MPVFDGIKQQTGYDFLGSLGIKQDPYIVDAEDDDRDKQ